MRRRQIIPEHWFIAVGDTEVTLAAVTRLPRGSGVVLLTRPPGRAMRRFRAIGKARGLTIVREATGTATRVHNLRELRAALLANTPLILLSPLYPTRSHPEWAALPRMRAAALARLSGRRLIALGGMNDKRFARMATLGFIGWAGISAFRT